jgi:hypothetical protein
MATKGGRNMYKLLDVYNKCTHLIWTCWFYSHTDKCLISHSEKMYHGGKRHLYQCDRLSVRLFRSGRDGGRKCSVPCNEMHLLWTQFSLLYPQYALVTYAVTWQVYAADELVCAMYLAFGRSLRFEVGCLILTDLS